MNPTAERRLGKRIVAQVPVQIRSATADPEQTAHTRDLSTNGVFLYTQSQMTEGSEIEMVMILPAELTGEKPKVAPAPPVKEKPAPPPPPRAVVDVFRGDKHVQEVFHD